MLGSEEQNFEQFFNHKRRNTRSLPRDGIFSVFAHNSHKQSYNFSSSPVISFDLPRSVFHFILLQHHIFNFNLTVTSSRALRMRQRGSRKPEKKRKRERGSVKLTSRSESHILIRYGPGSYDVEEAARREIGGTGEGRAEFRKRNRRGENAAAKVKGDVIAHRS